MKKAKIKIRNYRSIPYRNPLTMEINEGITFIVGQNNIGKSNLLKFFYEFGRYFGSSNQIQEKFSISGINSFFQIKHQKSEESIIEIEVEVKEAKFSFTFDPLDLNNSSNFKFKVNDTVKFHPPSLGFIHEIFSNFMYIGAFRNASLTSTGSYYDINIGTNFINEWDSWSNGDNPQKRTKIRELKNELKTLLGYNIFEISVSTDKRKLIVETDDGSFYLDELGGGLSHFILVLGNALLKNPNYILIDEPEIGLHPKMQELFIRTLASKSKYGVLATTHSIGLARSAGDYIFSLSKNEKKELTLSEFGNNYKPSITASLSEMGYSQFVELGGNNILLVEGRTDIKCFKEILRKYGLDHHFIILDLGGSNYLSGDNYDELNELKRLNAKSYSVIFDSERSSSDKTYDKKFEMFVQRCKELNFNVFPTDLHSTENYITQDAIRSVLGPKFKSLEPYEDFNSKSLDECKKWGKNQNWLMFRQMHQEDFHNTQLHTFIINQLKPLAE